MINLDETFTAIPAWTSPDERELLSMLSGEVNSDGLIVEIGCLYGGTTAVLALSNPSAKVTSIDNFSWTPEGYPKADKLRAEMNLMGLGITNARVMEGDSRRIGKRWNNAIDLLWVDGGHSYEFVYADLINFAPFSQVVAVHDYDNPAWPTIKKAVEVLINKYTDFYIDKVVGLVVVLRRR